MDKMFGHCNVTSPKDDTSCWRRAELTDLPGLKATVTGNRCRVFASSSSSDDIARTDNTLSLCHMSANRENSMFVSLCDRPNIACIAYEQWTEWFNHFYDLADVDEYNTLFVHSLLYRRVESLVCLPAMLETVYVQMPEIRNVIFIKVPGVELAAEMRSSFSSLPAKNVAEDPEYGCPEILYHTRRSSLKEIRLRSAIIKDYIDLRANLGDRLDFLDAFYGDYVLAEILRDPGDGRFNLVPTILVNGLIIINTSVNFSSLDCVFALHEHEGLAVSRDGKMGPNEIPLSDDHEKMENMETSFVSSMSIEKVKNELMLSSPYNKRLFDRMESINPTPHGDYVEDVSFFSNSDESRYIAMHESENDCETICQNEVGSNIFTKFLKLNLCKTSESKSSLHDSSHGMPKERIVHTGIDYEKTSFMIELMLIDEEEESRYSRDFLTAYFHEFPQYDYCLVTLMTIVTPPEFKKYFCKVFLKPNRYDSHKQLYALHRSSLFGNFTCAAVTKDNLEIAEDLIKNHPFERVVSDNISKSVFEDTRYKTYIFQCNDQPIGYCVIRLSDEITFLSRNFDVARYVYPELARSHSAVLLNMDIQTIFSKKVRCLLKYIMADNDINCLFYKLYSDSTIMEQNESSYISGIDELIPVKVRAPIQYDDENGSGDNFEKFALFHMNMRLCTTEKLSLDVKIVVVGASAVALSFLESLLFNPVNYYVGFENIVLISDDGMPYRVALTDLEEHLLPRVTRYSHEYMKAIALHSFVDVVTGTVTEINGDGKYVKVNGDGPAIHYDYLFLFNGEQFTHSVENSNAKPVRRRKNHQSSGNTTSDRSNDGNVSPENLFLLNSDRDIVHACKYIETMKSNDKAIIVYGKYLGSLSVISVLLECNIDGRRIVYIEPDDSKNLPFVDSVTIKTAVYDELSGRGVSVYEGFKFKKLVLSDDRTKIQKASFGSAVEKISFKCAGLFWFEQKSIVSNNWNILHHTFQFDGRLVISRSFETDVDCVYAAGPVARFNSSKYDPTGYAQYDSSEVGARVADVLMRRLRVVRGAATAVKLVRPLSVYCRLPGRHHYLGCTAPGPVLARKSLSVLKTGNAATGYFEIATDSTGHVMKLSCYSKADFKYSNLINLYGKNVSLFNDMVNRFRAESIPCFFDFFNESWAHPFYSDRFPKLLNDVMKLLANTKNKSIRKFSCDAEDVFTPEINQVCKVTTLADFDLEKMLMNFIDENFYDFPHFAHVRDAVNRTNST